MKVLYLNNAGEGFQRERTVPEATKVSEFVASQTQDVNFNDYTIRVNNEAVSQDYILQDGDKVTVIPTNVKGA